MDEVMFIQMSYSFQMIGNEMLPMLYMIYEFGMMQCIEIMEDFMYSND
ncbi:hypothetical protein F383_32364 [Gossypium arboreum]|uniref:Uncharacterized protein n=1 Tax=Gossypium arboreum TaxID=29729 RepID=A0A0B0MUV6_GOSAR|nr:hypothetical protein F383_32364 [Gossypium arboreum]